MARILFLAVFITPVIFADEFRLVLLPDTQYAAARYPDVLRAQMDWIVKNQDALKIRGVLGLGDIVDDGRMANQWSVVKSAMQPLLGRLPLFLAMGNHDYDSAFEPGLGARINFSYSRYAHPLDTTRAPEVSVQEFFEANRPENYWAKLVVGASQNNSEEVGILVLEFSPRRSVAEWAAKVLASHPNLQFLLITHSFMNHDDTRVSACDPYSRRNYQLHSPDEGLDGEELYDLVVQKASNLRQVWSGHIPVDPEGLRFDESDSGAIITQAMVDFQNWPEGGLGYMRLLSVDMVNNLVKVSTFSPYLIEKPKSGFSISLTTPEHAFQFPWHEVISEREILEKKSTQIVQFNYISDTQGRGCRQADSSEQVRIEVATSASPNNFYDIGVRVLGPHGVLHWTPPAQAKYVRYRNLRGASQEESSPVFRLIPHRVRTSTRQEVVWQQGFQ